jgi:hypothetical protein
MSISRRDFVKDSTITAIGTGLALSAGPFAGRVLGANDKIVIGVFGSPTCKLPPFATSMMPILIRPWR